MNEAKCVIKTTNDSGIDVIASHLSDGVAISHRRHSGAGRRSALQGKSSPLFLTVNYLFFLALFF